MKLASAKKELASVLGNDCFPAVPPLPPHVGRDLDAFTTTTTTTTAGRSAPSPTPHASSDEAPMLSPSRHAADPTTASLPAKLVKKRKTAAAVPATTATDADADADTDAAHLSSAPATDPDAPPARRTHSLKHAGKRLKRTSSRLHRKVSRGSIHQQADEHDDDVVVVVRPGGEVPPVPVLPSGVEGNRVRVDEDDDDGYGGLGHEIF